MRENGPIVCVVDDEYNLRELVARVVRSYGYDAVAYESAAEFLAALQLDRPTCLLLDVHLVDGTGFELFAELERRGVEIPTIFMTGAGTIPMTVRAMKAGAVEFLTKPLDWDALRESLEQAATRADAMMARRVERAQLRELWGRLTPREAAVFPYVVRGMSSKQIATELAIVEQTVKVHRMRLMQKLGTESIQDLMRLSERAATLGVELSPAAESPES